ncbi:SRPBCC family protein [soil metagenome]
MDEHARKEAGVAAQQVSAERVIDVPAENVFDVLVDPSQHPLIDGSGSVKGTRSKAPQRLAMGSRFGMSMRIGLPYPITNHVVEFEEGRLIAWRHFGGHRLRWELEPAGPGKTRVRETFDWSTSRSPKVLELMKAPEKNYKAMEATLERLDHHLTGA